MSAQTEIRRITVPEIAARKRPEQPIVSLTAYSAPLAELMDEHVDIILVGDSVGMVVHGMPSTTGVTMEMMIMHGQAVMRGSKRALVVVDMPFGSYEESPEQAFRNAARMMAETGCGAVKLEGGQRMAETIRFLTMRGIPVMGHVGLTPQATHVMGGFRAQGRDRDSWPDFIADIKAVADAGCFSIVIEGVMEELADRMTEAVLVPTIAIGGSARCDGQVLVLQDMLGIFDRVPRFVKKFGNLGPDAESAIKAFAAAVRDRSFPGPEHAYR